MNNPLPRPSARKGTRAVHPWRRRFSRQKRRFVASPLSGAGAPPTLPSIEAGRNAMTSTTRLMILTFPFAVNTAPLAALHVAMVHGAEQAVLPNQEYDPIVVR